VLPGRLWPLVALLLLEGSRLTKRLRGKTGLQADSQSIDGYLADQVHRPKLHAAQMRMKAKRRRQAWWGECEGQLGSSPTPRKPRSSEQPQQIEYSISSREMLPSQLLQLSIDQNPISTSRASKIEQLLDPLRQAATHDQETATFGRLGLEVESAWLGQTCGGLTGVMSPHLSQTTNRLNLESLARRKRNQ